MKVTVVPAQVTTIEDRIIGSLGFSQILLLITPVFMSAGIIVLLPPVMAGSDYKYVIISVLVLIFTLLAVRIKGKIIGLWLMQILRYNLRPRYYVFDKNTSANRKMDNILPATEETIIVPLPINTSSHLVSLTPRDTISALAAINDPARGVQFTTTKKGGLYVRLN